jgi:hypothetical protein
MKTFNHCTNCNSVHNWREVDYNNVLYVSRENAICITLCTGCVAEFTNSPPKVSSTMNYKERIDDILSFHKTHPNDEQIPRHQKASSESLLWALSF